MDIVKRNLAGEGSNALAKEFGLSGGMIRTWIKHFHEKGSDGLDNKRKPGNPLAGMYKRKNLSEIEKLRYELAKAEVEIAKLKRYTR